jgi:hypothetical protein
MLRTVVGRVWRALAGRSWYAVINVFIDSNIWNFVFDHQIDLAVALPSDRFCLYIPREVELEVGAIVRPEKAELKAFIESTIAKCDIRTDRLFGLYDDSLRPDEQRVGGFGEGRWASPEESAFIAPYTAALKTAKKRPTTPLYPKEADFLLAARASHSVVLSLDDKPGPIRDAYRQGDMVVFLTDFDKSGLSLGDFILRSLSPARIATAKRLAGVWANPTPQRRPAS